ncbi:DNA internalization-related competence protein ComEC/Rec2 [Enterococcus ratti]|uniref:DNA internalization-related competence protein ComEC/Rec2 n=1 Tax=Enterococcus ratti TaxID=150033 RepID=UPI0035148337
MFKLFCNQVQNRLVFPAISSIFICLVYYTDKEYNRLIFAGFFFFFLLKENKQVMYLSLSCSLLVFFSCWLKEKEPIVDKNTIERVAVVSDTVKLNGDLVHFVGLTNSRQKLHLSYYAKSEKERDSFLIMRREAITLVVLGDYQAPVKQRNAYAFDQVKNDNIHRIAGRFQIRKIKELFKENSWQNFLTRKRGTFITYIQNSFPNKVSVYMNALLFGYKDSQFLTSEETYKETGLLHLFSLSGMHIQAYLGWLYYLFRRGGFTLSFSFIPIVLLTLSYFVLTGGAISVLRAGILFLLKLALKLFKLKLSSLDCFSITLWLLLLIEPLCLFQGGGQLSVAMSFLFLLFPATARNKSQKIASIVLFSIGTLPLTVWHFYQWPVAGSVLTVLFAPIFLNFFLPLFVFLFLFRSYLPFFMVEGLEGLLGKFETFLDFFRFSTVIIGQPSFWLMIFSVGFFLWIIETKQMKPVSSMSYAMVIPCLMMFSRFFKLESSVTFSDVGQGDSILLTAPFQKETVMIDTGGKLSFQKEAWQKQRIRPYAEYNLVPFLKGKGISRINKLILTHNDVDHVGELATLSKQFKIDSVYIGWGAGNSPSLSKQLKLLKKMGTKIYEVKQEDQIKGYFDFFVLAPDKKGAGKNQDSIGLVFTYRLLCFLLLGDIDQVTEEKIRKRYPNLKADVIKLGHHGSRTSSSPKFIEQLAATYGVISCGLNNSFGHPHQEVLEILAAYQIKALRTDQQGSISFKWHPLWYPTGKIQPLIN